MRLIALLAFAGWAHAQTFEVASIKPSGPKSEHGWEGGPGSADPTRYRFLAASIQDLVVTAYHVEYFQVSSSLPIDKENIDLVANVPSGATKEQFRAMLRNLLAERFHLKVHTVSKAFPAYELVIAKTGLKLKETTIGAPTSAAPKGFPDLPPNRPALTTYNSLEGSFTLARMKAQQEPMSVIAHALQPPGFEPVVDKTGLTGRYDFTLEFSRELPNAPAAADPPSAPGIFTAVQQQLGLQLIPKKLPFDVVIVDSFDKAPAEN